jgi:ESF2/ABP1 family protein
MTTRKHNEYLDLGLSDEENETSQELDELEDSRNGRLKGISSRGSKRRKIRTYEDDDSSASGEEEEYEEQKNPSHAPAGPTTTQPSNITKKATASSAKSQPTKLKPLTPSQLAKSQLKARKTGVIYLSRIPPFMRPSTIRHLLSPYGEISRLFLTPEPPATYARRIKAGGNKKRSFIDGWVEFTSKKKAKICAETLNGQIIGGKKGGWYHDDIWNVKYLKGFKWGDLMAQVQDEERVREGRLRAEIQREGRERKAFLGNVEAAKREMGMEAKRKKKEEKGMVEGENNKKAELEVAVASEEGKPSSKKVFERRFRQNEIRTKGSQGVLEQPDEVKRVLSKIF